ncbi:triose-phosphate isomerase [Paenibacillus sp. MZ04-78.2]|uniref:triose-phosphate isomerase n=1 Tax=Paenibacillus sp. MZ04-78.2 TaxID=2962034 RepID=UPI0020B8AA30|nr:triose-phosphate isomerase [Paenibacillus sp. MZ04-78.2]MCP3773237.1 triose-phosphate isomerase [Paenibacillus sp. MZ04-78.2]
MTNDFKISKPFFEIGPKTYLYGKEAVELAVEADRLCEKYEVDIIFTAQYTDIEPISRATQYIKVFAQHMDPIYPGRGVGAVLPEAVKAAGAVGVLLNHAEKPLTMEVLTQSIKRAHEVGLATLVCAGSPEEGAAVACLNPDIILAESPALIGKGARGPQDMEEIAKINHAIHQVNPNMLILHGAGITDEKDVYAIIKAGADATGSTSGILKAEKPVEMMEKMIASVAEAWKIRKK